MTFKLLGICIARPAAAIRRLNGFADPGLLSRSASLTRRRRTNMDKILVMDFAEANRLLPETYAIANFHDVKGKPRWTGWPRRLVPADTRRTAVLAGSGRAEQPAMDITQAPGDSPVARYHPGDEPTSEKQRYIRIQRPLPPQGAGRIGVGCPTRDSDAQTQPEARSCVTVRSGLLRVPAQIGQRRTR
jgi:hypothetical protein